MGSTRPKLPLRNDPWPNGVYLRKQAGHEGYDRYRWVFGPSEEVGLVRLHDPAWPEGDPSPVPTTSALRRGDLVYVLAERDGVGQDGAAAAPFCLVWCQRRSLALGWVERSVLSDEFPLEVYTRKTQPEKPEGCTKGSCKFSNWMRKGTGLKELDFTGADAAYPQAELLRSLGPKQGHIEFYFDAATGALSSDPDRTPLWPGDVAMYTRPRRVEAGALVPMGFTTSWRYRGEWTTSATTRLVFGDEEGPYTVGWTGHVKTLRGLQATQVAKETPLRWRIEGVTTLEAHDHDRSGGDEYERHVFLYRGCCMWGIRQLNPGKASPPDEAAREKVWKNAWWTYHLARWQATTDDAELTEAARLFELECQARGRDPIPKEGLQAFIDSMYREKDAFHYAFSGLDLYGFAMWKEK